MLRPLTTGERSHQSFTSVPIEPGECGSSLPEFGRIPDVERLFGLKRGILYQLLSSGKIKSVCLRRKGARTGVRLVHLPSVREFLHAHLAKAGEK